MGCGPWRAHRWRRFDRLDDSRQLRDQLRLQVDTVVHGHSVGRELGAVLVRDEPSSLHRRLAEREHLRPDTNTSVDALLPAEMAERAEHVGVEKTRLDATSLLALAVLAGAFIAFGSMFSLVVSAGAEGVVPYGINRLLGGLVFSLGLILVIVGGAELFTGN